MFDTGQKEHFFEKRAQKISPTPYSISFLSVLHQNNVFHNFCKRGQWLIVKRNIGLEYALDNDLQTMINAKIVVCCSEYKQQKAFKKIKHRINAYSIASNQMVGLVCVRRHKEKNSHFLLMKSSIKFLVLFQPK